MCGHTSSLVEHRLALVRCQHDLAIALAPFTPWIRESNKREIILFNIKLRKKTLRPLSNKYNLDLKNIRPFNVNILSSLFTTNKPRVLTYTALCIHKLLLHYSVCYMLS